MSNNVQCSIHGESRESYVCSHLLGNSVGIGFNSDDPTPDNPYPDAWCDDCELIRATHGGWNEDSEKLVKISLLCSGCYVRSRVRNTRPKMTLDDLADLRWKCGTCDEWHKGPCLDFGHDAPHYWNKNENMPSSFLNADYCSIEDRDFFVRGLIHLPILGSGETFRWGIWGSLSRENFQKVVNLKDDQKRVDLPPMFSWLSSRIPDYPETLSMKMYAHIQPPGERPHFELEPSDHPLSREFYEGISPERIKELMKRRLRG